MDAHFNDNEALNSIKEILAERREIRRKLMIAVQEIREAAGNDFFEGALSGKECTQMLLAIKEDTSSGNDHRISS